MAPATELLDELIQEIFFHIHPADAATLTCAALVCRRWCCLIADPRFRRRLHEHHRVPHMLGFSSNIGLPTSTLAAHYYGPLRPHLLLPEACRHGALPRG
ncbi:unnamed protein product [Urochloa humidicola]